MDVPKHVPGCAYAMRCAYRHDVRQHKKNALRVKKPLRGLFRGSDLG